MELESLLRLRQQVFMLEQQSLYEDIDGLDQRSWHLLLIADARLAGYARLRADEQKRCYKFERLVLLPDYRGQGIGQQLVTELLSKAAQLGDYQRFELSAQTPLQSFYGRFGWRTVGDAYDDGGVEHIDMVLNRSQSK
ncbi:Protein ElaA [Saliniradius amylolyticus]|uniref:Protein ElaA n=2 Tax=Saliniradius amylolyticus TaxID=2183582 RepID=A0A2S2E435_9ALTE|nr:Protein ElaA [Saliniradius amylolyticus]